MTAWEETSPTRLSLATANPPDIYRGRRRGELGVVYGLNLKGILSMVREPHHDKKLISKIKIQKYFLGFQTCHSMWWFLGFTRKLCGGVHEWREISIWQLLGVGMWVKANWSFSFVVGFLLIFVCFWIREVAALRCLLFSHKKVGRKESRDMKWI